MKLDIKAFIAFQIMLSVGAILLSAAAMMGSAGLATASILSFAISYAAWRRLWLVDRPGHVKQTIAGLYRRGRDGSA